VDRLGTRLYARHRSGSLIILRRGRQALREARNLGLRVAAEHLGISPAYLSRIERGKERPPKPELIKKIARLLGGDPDLLFRLGTSTDPDIAEYMNFRLF
jgi:transcriptional regulator with XRE-family HTH domain